MKKLFVIGCLALALAACKREDEVRCGGDTPTANETPSDTETPDN